MPKLLSVHDAACFLRVSDQHIRSLIRQGTLDAERVGKQWIISDTNLEQYIDENNIIIEPLDHPRQSVELPDIVALSFFSGAMGLDIGIEAAGISPLLACEVDKETRKTIHANRPEIALIGNVCNYSAERVKEFARIPKNHTIDVIYGGPPCQAFSTAGKQRGFEDERGNVFLTFINLAIELSPKYLVLENVRGLLSAKYPIKKGGAQVKGGALHTIITRLRNAGYAVSFELYNAANFGAPQIRERIVMLCKKGGKEMDFLMPTHAENGAFGLLPWVTLGDAINNLDITHHYVHFPEKRLRYYRMLRAGQNWRDLPPEIQPIAMGKSYALPGGKTGFYRRLCFDRPSPTLVTHPAMPATDLCHPTENRPLSIEEYKLIQGFPDNWVVCGRLLDIYRQIGNAVPIPLGKAVGRALIADMRNEALSSRDGFQYSRYHNTNHMQFLASMRPILAISNSSSQGSI